MKKRLMVWCLVIGLVLVTPLVVHAFGWSGDPDIGCGIHLYVDIEWTEQGYWPDVHEKGHAKCDDDGKVEAKAQVEVKNRPEHGRCQVIAQLTNEDGVLVSARDRCGRKITLEYEDEHQDGPGHQHGH